MEGVKAILLTLTFLLSLFTFVNTFKYRKKDFQIYLLKEQVETSKELEVRIKNLNFKTLKICNFGN